MQIPHPQPTYVPTKVPFSVNNEGEQTNNSLDQFINRKGKNIFSNPISQSFPTQKNKPLACMELYASLDRNEQSLLTYGNE